MSNIPEVLTVIDGVYDEWVPLRQIADDAEIADTVKTISCDTRDFALGWNFKKPEPYKKAECGLEDRTNEGLARARRIEHSKALGDYLIEPVEIVPWLKKLCEIICRSAKVKVALHRPRQHLHILHCHAVVLYLVTKEVQKLQHNSLEIILLFRHIVVHLYCSTYIKKLTLLHAKAYSPRSVSQGNLCKCRWNSFTICPRAFYTPPSWVPGIHRFMLADAFVLPDFFRVNSWHLYLLWLEEKPIGKDGKGEKLIIALSSHRHQVPKRCCLHRKSNASHYG